MKKYIFVWIVVGLLLASFGIAARAAGTIYVDADATGANDGSSWADAYTDLQDALSAASSGDEIWVAEGVYKPGAARTDSFTLVDGVGLYGGFDGTESARSERDWETNVTTLSGDIAGDNVYHVVFNFGVTGSPVLDGFTVTAGQADGSGTDVCGGGMYNYACNPTLTNVTLISNTVSINGGGIYNVNGSNPTLTNVTLSGNTAGGNGGGMGNYNSHPTLTNVTLISNTASINGGGMYNYACNPTLTNVALISNTAGSNGGGMYNYHFGNPTLTNVTLSGNTASYDGGGMYNYNSHPTLANCVLWGNSPDEITNDSSSASVTYSDIQGSYTGTGNINADPLFVDAANGNLRLQAGSPCIDAGNNLSVTVSTDLDGNPRRDDVPTVPDTGNGTAPHVDMGAYEVQFEANPSFFFYLPIVFR